jgi:hypothetical protein
MRTSLSELLLRTPRRRGHRLSRAAGRRRPAPLRPRRGTDEPLVWYEGATVSDATRRYLHADHQGSIIAWSDAAGSTSGNTYTYGPYGEPRLPGLRRT